MPIYTNYTLLTADEDYDTLMIQQIEGFTGAKEIYGFGTPINLVDILDNCGPEITLNCFANATTDTSELGKVIAIEWVKAHVYAYALALPGDSRPFDLMYYLELFLAGENDQIPERLDYCGNNLSGSGLITTNQLEDVENNIQAAIDALSLDRDETIYTMVVQNNGQMTEEQYAAQLGGNIISIDRGNEINDPAWAIPNGTPGYIEQNTATILASNPDYFLQTEFSYDAASPYFYVIRYQQQGGGNVLVNFAKRGAQSIGEAAIFTSQQVREDTASLLPTIFNAVRSGVEDYNAAQRVNLKPKLTRYQQFANGLPAINSGVPEWELDGQAVYDAGTNVRAALLRDASFLATFDVDSSGTLNAAERLAAELGLQDAVLNARRAAGQALYDDVFALFQSFTGTTDTLVSIFRTYLLI